MRYANSSNAIAYDAYAYVIFILQGFNIMYTKKLKIGTRFGTRRVIEELETRKNGYIMYKVQCDCGDVVILNGSYLRSRGRPCKCCSAKLHTKKGKDHYSFKH